MNGKFSPPLYQQRHQFVIEFVRKCSPRTLLDLGCADCSLLRKLKFHRHTIELLAGVDLDCAAVRKKLHALDPLFSDYLQPNDRPLTIELYHGSVTEREPRTRGFDLVTCIELIEHLHLWEVERFSDVVFGYMAPHAVIVSTPNAEFNPLLPGLRGFRHSDHKFEWSRTEFQTWANRVCWKYGYSVEFTGVGEALPQVRDVGFCSQIAVFQRAVSDQNTPIHTTHLEPTVYRLLYRVVYPSLHDHNIFQRTLVCEVLYRAERLKQEWLEEMESVGTSQVGSLAEAARWVGERADGVTVCRRGRWVCVPLQHVWAGPRVRALCENVQCLREALLEDSRVRLDANGAGVMLSVDEEEEVVM